MEINEKFKPIPEYCFMHHVCISWSSLRLTDVLFFLLPGTVFKLCFSNIMANLTIQKKFLYDAVHKKSSTNPVLVELFEETLCWNC